MSGEARSWPGLTRVRAPSPAKNGAPQYGTFSNRLARAFDATSMLRDARTKRLSSCGLLSLPYPSIK
jgi:hypothetical protein